MILGYGLWQRRFGGSPEVIGKVIQLDGVGPNVRGRAACGLRVSG